MLPAVQLLVSLCRVGVRVNYGVHPGAEMHQKRRVDTLPQATLSLPGATSLARQPVNQLTLRARRGVLGGRAQSH
ncbi:hypothetical protein VZT92_027089 [Zoarces viviparus]|uniref:Secreted protein n=1 Tax=Zoarces viviparus TaxID=48416 RepID=A0AAW1DTT5_ZOAVI